MAFVDRNVHGTPSVGFSVDPALSGDGGRVLFVSDSDDLVPGDTNGTTDVFVRDMDTETTERVSVSTAGLEGNGPSGMLGAVLADDGTWSAFASAASNLVRHDTNGRFDVFVRG
jgi:Tol biopolymer transport system component